MCVLKKNIKVFLKNLTEISLYCDLSCLLSLNQRSSDTAFKHLILHDSTPVPFLSETHTANCSQNRSMGSFIVQM